MSKNIDVTRRNLVVAAALALGGCSGAATVLESYALSPPPGRAEGYGKLRGQLLVIEPKALASLDTDRIVVRQPGGATAYLPGGAWADRLPKLLQARTIEAFENARLMTSVGRPGDRLASDWQLLTDIRAFDFLPAEGQVQISLSVKLVNDRNGRIVAASLFSERAGAAGADAKAVTAAFDEALQRALVALVAWTAHTI